MEEVFDNLLTKVLFSGMLLAMLFVYRYAHLLLYPQAKKQVENLFNPYENLADSIHYFSRIIGICIVFSSFEVHLSESLFIGVVNFLFLVVVDIIFYLLALYVMELVVLHAFQYQQEILKRKNLSYAIINATMAICLSFLIKHIVEIANASIPFMVILSLYTLVIFGMLIKQYHLISRFPFSKSVLGQDMGVAISHAGFVVSITVVIYFCFEHTSRQINNFITSSLTNLLLCGILLPLFYYGIQKIFLATQQMVITVYDESKGVQYNIGLTEATLFLTSSLLTVIIVFGANL